MAQVIYSQDSDDVISPDIDTEIFAKDVMAGLSAKQKYIPASYHYDAEGSRLFNKITELPEYYLTRCEADALERNKDRIADLLTDGTANLIELGPADGSKTGALMDYFHTLKIDFHYVAVDISHTALEQLANDYQSDFPDQSVDCLVANYVTDLKWLKNRYHQKNLVLFLGSSIGNFNAAQTKAFLQNLRQNLKSDDMVIIGFDLVKETELIRRAYNDSENVTAEFNYNLLRRINRELDADFDVTAFRFEGLYNTDDSVMRSYLISLKEQEVYIGALKRSFGFRTGESIHTEDSHKYRESDIEELAAKHGFSVKSHLYDSHRYFVDSIWVAR